MLERERVGRLQRNEAAEQEDGRDPEWYSEQDRRDEQKRGDRLGGSRWQLAARDRAGALYGMSAVVLPLKLSV